MRRAGPPSPEGDILRFIRRYGVRPAPESEFDALARKAFLYQFEQNPFYRRYCEQEGRSPGTTAHWREIPALPAAAFRETRLASFPGKKAARVFRSSGTTGHERSAHYFRTLRLYDEAVGPPFRKYLLDGSARLSYFFLTPSPAEAPSSSLSYMMGRIRRRFAAGRGGFYVKKGRPHYGQLCEDLEREARPAVLLSTAFALMGFLDHLRESGKKLRLAPGSRLMETGGFKGRTKAISRAALYRLCQERLGIPRTRCVGEYGMTELTSQYYSGPSGLFSGPSWLRALVVDPETGLECKKGLTGLLRHLDLANLGSVIAVQTEDLGRERDGGFELLGRAETSPARGCSLAYESFLAAGA